MESLLFLCLHPCRCDLCYLHGTLHDERGELGNHEVHAFEAGLFQFEDLLFDNRLESQVRGEEPRSRRPVGKIAFCCGGRQRGIGRNEGKRKKKKRGQPGKRKRRNKKRQILCSVSHF